LHDIFPKSLPGTRWSARSVCTRALKNYEIVYSVQQCTAAKNNETMHAHNDAYTLAKKMEKYELAFLGVV
jgi:hypothetical protein